MARRRGRLPIGSTSSSADLGRVGKGPAFIAQAHNQDVLVVGDYLGYVNPDQCLNGWRLSVLHAVKRSGHWSEYRPWSTDGAAASVDPRWRLLRPVPQGSCTCSAPVSAPTNQPHQAWRGQTPTSRQLRGLAVLTNRVTTNTKVSDTSGPTTASSYPARWWGKASATCCSPGSF